MNAFDSPKKPHLMPGTKYEIVVNIFTSESGFPGTGTVGEFYFAGTLSDYEAGQGTLKYWNGSMYQSFAGPRPVKPPHNP